KDSVAAEDHVADARNAGDLEGDVGMESADVAGMNAEGFSGGEVLGDNFAGEFEPCSSLAGDALEDESVAAEDTGAEGLLEADAESDLGCAAEEAVAMEHEVAGAQVNRNDVAGDAGSEGELAGGSDGSVFGHEKASAASDSLDG